MEPNRKVAIGLVCALALVHLGLALWFASITPYRQAGRILISRGAPAEDIGAPDERQHVNYVRNLLDGKGFPVFNPKDPNLYEDYQSHQPPLFYILEAGWSKLTGTSDLTDKDAGLKLRSINALIGAGTVVAVALLGAWGFRSKAVGIVSAAFAALLPMNVALSGSVGNDPLLFLLCTTALALCAKAVWSGWSVKLSAAVGVSVGLALLTKTTALALVPAVLVGALVSKPRPDGKAWAAALVPIFVLALPWWFRNQSLYGDPFAMTAFNQAFTGSAQAKPLIEAEGLSGYLLNWVGWWTIRSFFGVFGYMDIWLNETGAPVGSAHNTLYRLLIVVSVLVFLGWVMSWKRLSDRPYKVVQAVNLTFFAVVVLLFLRFNLQYFQAQARYVLPAIGPIAIGFGLGALELAKRKWPVALALLVVIFGGTSIYAGTRLPTEFDRRSQSLGG